MRAGVVLTVAGALLAAGASAQSDPRPAQVLAAIGEETGPDSRYAIAFSDLATLIMPASSDFYPLGQ